MNQTDLLQILARGEDSRHQFKRDETSADSIAAELAAFANSGGGMLLLGAADDGSVVGLDAASVRRLNQLISNAASQNVRPPIQATPWRQRPGTPALSEATVFPFNCRSLASFA